MTSLPISRTCSAGVWLATTCAHAPPTRRKKHLSSLIHCGRCLSITPKLIPLWSSLVFVFRGGCVVECNNNGFCGDDFPPGHFSSRHSAPLRRFLRNIACQIWLHFPASSLSLSTPTPRTECLFQLVLRQIRVQRIRETESFTPFITTDPEEGPESSD